MTDESNAAKEMKVAGYHFTCTTSLTCANESYESAAGFGTKKPEKNED